MQVGGKVTNLEKWSAWSLIDVRKDRSHQRSPPLGTHHDIELSVLLTVLEPNQKFPTAHPFLSLCDGAASDAVHNHFAPELILTG
ncbi:Uncharacterised protein [Klebsiella pneumoniae]|nr:hypothetical protein AM343_002738 [Klebsiella variicola]SLN98323.1 Uncharacterised protein [Klebsiella pneumoniae]SLO19748.1 Uncharacterised protein [Klebsiella pneumoniae]SLO25846.1 Uncharacterised protein [Klebsiella pneumoniae]SLO31855.1 Uncharacterised protein [Klebsiella pneumoniae]